MTRIIYCLAAAIVLAGIVHIAVVLLIPSYAARDAWANLSAVSEKWNFKVVANPGERGTVIPLNDPAVGVAACIFDLRENALRVDAAGALPFWSVAVFDRRGQNIYSFNDRTAIENRLLLLVVDPVQRAQLRKTADPELDGAVIVETDSRDGFVLLRALQSDESWKPVVSKFLAEAECSQFETIVVEETSQ